MMRKTLLRSVRRLYSSDVVNNVEAVAAPKLSFKERLRRFGKDKAEVIKTYWIRVYEDYREVAIDTVKDIKARPANASKYFTALGLAGAAIHLNPTEKDYHIKHLEAVDSMILLTNLTKNPKAETHVNQISRLENTQQLRRLGLVFFSLIWTDNYDPSAGIFESQCGYLKPSLKDFYKRVVDIGFCGRWWIYEEKMKDFDVNPSEWGEGS